MSAPPEQRRKFPLQLEVLNRPPSRTLPKPAGAKSVAVAVAQACQPVRPAPAVLRPQRPLQQAAAESARVFIKASGSSLADTSAFRRRMVERLRGAGLSHPAVIEAMNHVPRHAFVDAALGNQAYEDTSLPIGLGQTISKPSVVARMIELLMQGVHARANGTLGQALEIGTGCGYQAAVLARLAKQLLSVERLRPLHDKARELLAPLRLSNVRLVYGDGMRGHPPNAPYSSIIAAAGGEAIPSAWLEQLAVGGRLVAPVQEASGSRQVLVVVDRTTEDVYERSVHEAVNFVPLKSGMN